MENLSKTVGELYTELGKQFLPVVKAVIGVIMSMVDWIKSTIATIRDFAGSNTAAGAEFRSAWGGIADFFSAVGAYIGKVCSWIVKQFMLIPAYGNLIGVSVMNLFCNLLPAYLTAFGKNFVILCTWIWDNWRDILATLWSYLKNGFMNVIENIKAFWTGLWNFIKGKGWHVDWKDLSDGAVNSIKKMPEFVKAATDPMWDKMQQEALDKIKGQERAIDAFAEKNKITAGTKEEDKRKAKGVISDIVTDGIKPLENIKEKSKSSSMVGVLDIWKNAQQSLMKNAEQTAQLGVARQQLKEQQETNRLTRALVGKPRGKTLTLSK
jgi:hypothetical protein